MRRFADAGPVVMGTGIVSVTLDLTGHDVLSWLLLVVTAAAWLAVAAGVIRSRRVPPGPEPLALVAATAVLGSRLLQSNADAAGAALLILAFAVWLAVLPCVAAERLPRRGSSFLITVAVQSLAVLAALLVVHTGTDWITWPALLACVLGLVLYAPLLVRFDRGQVLSGAGDQWIAGGALAISALALSELSAAAGRTSGIRSLVPALHAAALVVWAAGIVWLIVLIVAEIHTPRLRYDPRRWATVFPVGMYGACSFEAGHAAGFSALQTFAHAWAWPALAVWIAVAGGGVARGLASRSGARR
jgi:hypothetical protein